MHDCNRNNAPCCRKVQPLNAALFGTFQRGEIGASSRCEFPQANDNFPRHFPCGERESETRKTRTHCSEGAGPVSLASQRRRINEKSFHFNSFSLKNTPYTFHVHKSSGIVYYIILYIGSTWETWEAGNKLNFLSAGEKGKR